MSYPLLIVVDMQNDFISGSLGTPEARAIVPRIVSKIKAAEKVYFTMDVHFDDYLDTAEGKALPIPHCISNTRGCLQPPEIATACSEPNKSIGFSKNTFGSTHLMQRIGALARNKKLESIEFVGVCTDICVITNVLMAKTIAPEVPIFVDASCCAGTTPERHRAALDVMKSCQIQIINEEVSDHDQAEQ